MMVETNNKKNNKNNKQLQPEATEGEGDLFVTVSRKDYEELLKKDKDLAEHQDKLIRLHADFDNLRKRFQREKEDIFKYANEKLISELLVVVDDFERAVDSAEKSQDFKLMHDGVQMISNHLCELLKRNGLLSIGECGEHFDPLRHEAIAEELREGAEAGIVLEVLQKGYSLNGKVIRPAKVKVSKGGKENG